MESEVKCYLYTTEKQNFFIANIVKNETIEKSVITSIKSIKDLLKKVDNINITSYEKWKEIYHNMIVDKKGFYNFKKEVFSENTLQHELRIKRSLKSK